jgi:hypothetical protein
MTRYKVTCRDPNANPFRGSGVSHKVMKGDVDAAIPLEQVETWARESATEAGLEFIKLEPVAR